MIGQGFGPGGNFSWWDLKGNNFERNAKAASDAITIRAQEEKDSIWSWWELCRIWLCEFEAWCMGFIYLGKVFFFFFLILRFIELYVYIRCSCKAYTIVHIYLMALVGNVKRNISYLSFMAAKRRMYVCFGHWT